MSDLQAWVIASLLSVIAIHFDPNEAIEIVVLTQGALAYDRWKKKS